MVAYLCLLRERSMERSKIASAPATAPTSSDLDVFSIRSLVHMIEIYFTCVSLILIFFFKYSGSVVEAPSGKVLPSELKILKNKKVVYVYFPIDAQNIHVTDPGLRGIFLGMNEV